MEIADNVKSVISSTKDVQFEKIFSLSYTHLPHHLRPCLLYMGAFPEDYEIRASKLIQLCIAEGFLKYARGSKSYEEVAEEYLEDLVRRSLVSVTKRKSYGQKIKSCSMHDLVRELCIEKAEQEKFLVHNNKNKNRNRGDVEFNKNQSRVSIDGHDLNSLRKIYGSDIRTIICFRSIATSLGSLRELRLLKVLDMVKSSSPPILPLELFRLFHLRYLSLDFDVRIPRDPTIFQNLQTLIILSSSDLPLNIWEMPQLRHLISSSVDLLPKPPVNSLVLTNLKTLLGVRNVICTIRIIRRIPNLKKMKIFYDEDVYGRDLQLHNLARLHQLENLELKIDGLYHCHMMFNPVFPTSLKKLTLSGCRIPWKDMTKVGSLPNLQVLKLRDSSFEDGANWATNDGEFEQLEFLLIEKSQIKEWITERSHFPRLKCLLLHHCSFLNEIPDGIGESSTLELIEVKGNNTSLVESAKWIQEQQNELRYDNLQVHCFDF